MMGTGRPRKLELEERARQRSATVAELSPLYDLEQFYGRLDSGGRR